MEKDLILEYQEYLKAQDKRIRGFRYASSLLSDYLQESSREFLGLTVQSAQDFQSWLSSDEKGYSAGTILSIIGPLSSFYDYLKKRKYIAVNPFDLIDRVKKSSRLPGCIPDEKEMDELLGEMKTFTRGGSLRVCKGLYKAHVVAEVLYSTGMRIGEVSAIRTDDVDLQRGTVLVRDSKTRSLRTAFLNEYCCQILDIYINEMREKVLWLHNGADPDLLFGSSKNLQISFAKILKDACIHKGFEKLTPHSFRHAFGYHMLRSGCDIRMIQKFLGHERLDTTSIYAKVDTRTLRNIVDRYHPRKGRS